MCERTHVITTVFENRGEGSFAEWIDGLKRQGWTLSYAGHNRYTGTRTITYTDPGEPVVREAA